MSKKGFSLTEILLSIALVGLAILTLSGVMISGIEAITKGSAYTEATTIAKSRMEKILYTVNDDYNAIDDPNHWLRQDSTVGNYKLTVELTSGSAYGSQYKKVIVEVKGDNEKDKRKGVRVRLESVFIKKSS